MVGALIQALSEQLLGRHVVDRPWRIPGLCHGDAGGVVAERVNQGEVFRQSEVEQLHDARRGDEDVGRLDVPVDDVEGVHRGEP